MKNSVLLIALVIVGLTSVPHGLAAKDHKKVLYVASYHTRKGEWPAGIKAGIDAVFASCRDVRLQTFNMDTRLAKTEAQKSAAGAAARQAILDGKSPREISIVRNKRGTLYLNMDLAKKLGIKFPVELIERAHLVSAD